MPATVWKGSVSFGLVSFPVRLYAAARGQTVHSHMLHGKDLSRLKEVWFCAKEDKRIERSEIVKGYEVGKEEYVVIDDADLKKIAPATASTIDIVQFVRRDEVDPIYFERSYYVAPDGKVVKPYALLLGALQKTNYDAIGKLSMHGREHVTLIRPADEGLVLHTLFYANELQSANRYRESGKINPKELDLAVTLIQQLVAPFKPAEFHDGYRENVEALIKQKQKGEKISPVAQPRKAQVIDLMDALKRSLQRIDSRDVTKRKPKANRSRKVA
jgi:DNA end-binding protein Ku